MRIALMTETWHPFTNGVVTHIDVLAEGLRSLDHEVLIVTADPTIRHHEVDMAGVLRSPALAVKKVYGYGLASPFSWKRFSILREFSPDIIHIHQEFGIGTFGFLASRVLQIPLVYTLHTAYDEYLHYLAPPPLVPAVRTLSRSYVKMLASVAAVSTGPSEKSAAYLRARRVTTPFVYIPNSADLIRFHPNHVSPEMRESYRRKLDIPEQATVAVFSGRLGREKSVEQLLEYWSKTIDFQEKPHLILVGDGPEREELQRQAQDLGLTRQVHFMGKIPYENMPLCYGAADLFVTASTTEMMSISLLEAQAMGLPVLQRFDSWNAGQVLPGVNGFTYESPLEFIDRLQYFHQLHACEKEEWRLRCREQVARQGASDLASQLLAVYRQAHGTRIKRLAKA